MRERIHYNPDSSSCFGTIGYFLRQPEMLEYMFDMISSGAQVNNLKDVMVASFAEEFNFTKVYPDYTTEQIKDLIESAVSYELAIVAHLCTIH